MNHRINIVFETHHISNLGMGLHIRKCIRCALDQQGVDHSCEVNVLVTDNDGIHKINLAARNVDSPTDVLSFPMFEFTAGKLPDCWDSYEDPGSGRVNLGDMVLSYEKAVEQGMEFGHGVKREVGYLTVHSILHLLGYDHLDEGEMKQQMRREEEKIMEQLMLQR